MCNHAHNNIRDTSVVNIYIYFRYIYTLWKYKDNYVRKYRAQF